MIKAKHVLLFLLLVPMIALSQVRTGTIYGYVMDEQGTMIPGAAVRLTSAVIGTMTTVTSEEGRYRFVALPPASDYTITAELEGFATKVRKNIRVIVGQNVNVNIELSLGKITEKIEVTAKPSVVDLRKTTVATNVTRELLQSLPTARDPWVILQKTPGIMLDRENVGGNESGQQSSWSSRGEGRSNSQWNVDGVEVTDPTAPGSSGMYYDYDMFEEMQIQTAANDVTAMTGGVNINFVTKRGSDAFSGGARFYLTDDSLQSSNVPGDVLESDLSGNRIRNIRDYGFNIGGPITKGRAWFWLAYGVQDIGLVDVVGDPDDTLLRTLNAKFNLTLGNHRLEIYAVYNDKIKEGRKRYELDLYEASRKQTGPAYILKIQDEIAVGNNMLISLQGSYTPTSYALEPYGGRNVPVYEEYRTFRYNTGTWEEYSSDIFSGSLLIDYFKENFLFGDHEFKLGLDYRHSSSLENSQLGNGLHLQIRPGKSFYYGTLYREWYFESYLSRFSAFVQDTINIGNLVVLAGLRYDNQSGGVLENTIPGTTVPEVSDVGGVDYNWAEVNQSAVDLPFNFSFLSPRLGLTWDLTGKGTTVIKANFAIYGSTLDLGYLRDNYLIDSYHEFDWVDYNDNLVLDPGELYFYRTRDNLDAVETSDPAFFFAEDLKPEKTMELLVGMERQISEDVGVGLNLIYRRYYDQNWSVPYVWDGGYRLVNADDWSQYTIDIDGRTYYYWDTPIVYDEGIGQFRLRPDYSVNYTAVELTVNKRLADKWLLSGSFTYQDTNVNYDSSAAYIDPTDHAPVDLLDGTSGPHSYNEFVLNSRWMLKLNWLYQLPWDINFAGAFQTREGYIFPTIRTLTDAGRRNWDYDDPVVLTEEFGSSRYPTFWMLDLRLEKAFSIRNVGRFYLSLDAFNVTNNNMALSIANDLDLSTYNTKLIILNPRVIRLGLRFQF